MKKISLVYISLSGNTESFVTRLFIFILEININCSRRNLGFFGNLVHGQIWQTNCRHQIIRGGKNSLDHICF